MDVNILIKNNEELVKSLFSTGVVDFEYVLKSQADKGNYNWQLCSIPTGEFDFDNMYYRSVTNETREKYSDFRLGTPRLIEYGDSELTKVREIEKLIESMKDGTALDPTNFEPYGHPVEVDEVNMWKKTALRAAIMADAYNSAYITQSKVLKGIKDTLESGKEITKLIGNITLNEIIQNTEKSYKDLPRENGYYYDHSTGYYYNENGKVVMHDGVYRS